MIIDFSKKIDTNALVSTSEYERKIISFVKKWVSGQPTFEIQTSGSTGKPKMISVERQKMINSAEMTCQFFDLKKGDSALVCLPVEYISGKMMLVRAIVAGLKLYIENPHLNPMKNFDQKIDFCAMTPLQVQNSLEEIHRIKKLIIGGAEVSNSLKSKLENSPNFIYETYGMSETLSHIALRQISPQREECFKTFQDASISVDERGCAVIKSLKLSAEKIITNDLVEIIRKNEFKLLGRIDNVINSGGVKIFPEQVEKIIQQITTKEIILLGKKDEFLGEKLVLLIEGKQDDVLVEQINNLNFENKIQKPKEIVFVKQFFRTENGKIKREENKQFLN